jgi:hypothetical protein
MDSTAGAQCGLQDSRRFFEMTDPSSTALVVDAIEFAAHEHRSQRRKDVEATPYINHPIALMRILVCEAGIDDPDVLAAQPSQGARRSPAHDLRTNRGGITAAERGTAQGRRTRHRHGRPHRVASKLKARASCTRD